jgi:hypothetical protein
MLGLQRSVIKSVSKTGFIVNSFAAMSSAAGHKVSLESGLIIMDN